MPELQFQQPVIRRLVHRAAMAEVFVTDAVNLGEDRFLVAAQWPRDHALYHPDCNGYSDPLLFAETIRQSLVYLAHQFHGVPLTHRFVGRDMEFEITDPELLCTGTAPLPLVLEATWVWVDNKPPHRYGMRLEACLTVDGRPCGRGSLTVLAVDAKRYGLLRKRGVRPGNSLRVEREETPERVAPHRVGRLRAKDCVLQPVTGGTEWLLGLDLDHAILFDHPTDHIPLMALLEGFRQVGHLLSHESAVEVGRRSAARILTAVDLKCLAFGELDQRTHLIVKEIEPQGVRGGPTLLRVDAVQNGNPVATVGMRWTDAWAVTVPATQRLTA